MTLSEPSNLFREPRHWGKRDRQILMVTIFTILLWIALVYITGFGDPVNTNIIRYGSAVPVAVAAYFYGMGAGVAVALFFGTAFWSQVYAVTTTTGFTTNTAQLMAVTFLLLVIAYVVADLSGTLQSQSKLSSAVRDREALLGRATSFNRVTGFILRQARQVVEADLAWLILPNPLNGEWEVVANRARLPLLFKPESDYTLAHWLLEQEEPILIPDLDADDSILIPRLERGGPRSLISRPLYHSDGTPMGRLVVANTSGENFTAADLAQLDDLAKAGQKAIEQAGMYARTDFALEQRVQQLAAIQRTTRELNSTFDMVRIREITLACAVEITQAESGTIVLALDELVRLLRERSLQLVDRTAHSSLVRALRDGVSPVLMPGEIYLPPFEPNAESQLMAFIQRRGQTLGAIVVESLQPQAFDETAGWALSLLADHVAVAMENARLFSEVEKEKQRIALIIAAIADGLITTDWKGTVVSLNPAAERLTGWSSEDLSGQPLNTIFQVADDEVPSEQPALLRRLKHMTAEDSDRMVVRQKVGSKIVVSVSAAPVMGDENNRPVGLAIVFRDITAKEELDRVQQEMIAAISHEMRSPLTRISSIAETFQEQLRLDLTPKQEQHLEILVAESQRLSRFIDRMLNVHRLETSKFQVQNRPVPVSIIIDELVGHWQKAAPEHPLNLAKLPHPPIWVWADESSLMLVLNNLMDNAVKYSPAGMPISVQVALNANGMAQFTIDDRGPGVPAEFQSRIFDRFYRVDGRDAQVVYGHGLGLYISRMLVGAMGGQIWVESEVGQGSRFVFTLPVVHPGETYIEEVGIESENPGH